MKPTPPPYNLIRVLPKKCYLFLLNEPIELTPASSFPPEGISMYLSTLDELHTRPPCRILNELLWNNSTPLTSIAYSNALSPYFTVIICPHIKASAEKKAIPRKAYIALMLHKRNNSAGKDRQLICGHSLLLEKSTIDQLKFVGYCT